MCSAELFFNLLILKLVRLTLEQQKQVQNFHNFFVQKRKLVLMD